MAQRLKLVPCSTEFITLLNRAQEELAMEGRWWGTYQRLRILGNKSCIVWPADVAVVERLQICRDTVMVRNSWYEFEAYEKAPALRNNDWYNNEAASQLLDRGLATTYGEWDGVLNQLRFYPTNSSDVGKRILVQGVDQNGVQVRTQDSVSGDWIDGEYVTLAYPYATTANIFQYPLAGLQKPITDGWVSVTTYNTITGSESQVANYHPYEQNPAYRRTYLTQSCCRLLQPLPVKNSDGCNSDNCWPWQIYTALVSKSFSPAYIDTDWLFISMLGALESMMRSIQLADEYDQAGANFYRSEATRKLRNYTERMEGGKERTAVNIQPLGSAHNSRVLDGMM